MSFPLYRRPGGVVFLDDDADYLQMLGRVMPANWYVRLLTSPVCCIELFVSETARLESDARRQQDIVNCWREGVPLISGILDYWQQDGSARFGFTQVCVVDYAMPAMSGLQVVGELKGKGWPGARVLLTGRVEEQLAVSALNRGLIERFLPKQSSDLRLRLTDAITTLLDRPLRRQQQLWRATLSRGQRVWLSDAALRAQLVALAERENWIEHVVIGSPFGVLALDSEGRASWLQLEREDKLCEMADMAQSEGWDEPAVQDIRAGRALIDFELKLALGAAHQPQPQPSFALGRKELGLLAALFRLPSWRVLDSAQHHARFLAARQERALPG
ncbi:MAG: response regulator [Polaromonas sp.]|nr:response regulator [Polaromonas sp.]